MNEPKKQKKLREANHNVKTLYRPFKKCFKSQIRINEIEIINTYFEPILKSGSDIIKNSNSRGHTRVRYASIKGCCGLQRNGYLR